MSRLGPGLAAVALSALAVVAGQVPARSYAVTTVQVTVGRMAAADANSTAAFAAEGSAVVAANGDIEVREPTELRFVFAPAQRGVYAPVGITIRRIDPQITNVPGDD